MKLKDDHHYVQTSTKFFYNSKHKNPKNECTLTNGCIIRSPNDLTRCLKLYLGWLGFLISTHVRVYEYPDSSRILQNVTYFVEPSIYQFPYV